MRGATRQRWRRTLLSGVLLGAVALLTRSVPLHDVARSARAIGLASFGIAAVGWFALVVLQSLRWRLVTRHAAPVSFRDALALRIVGQGANVVLPARGGDLLRMELVSRLSGKRRADVVGAEVMDVWVDKIGWLVAFALVVLLGSPPVWVYRVAAVAASLPLLAFVVIRIARPLAVRASHGDWKRAAVIALCVAPTTWVLETMVLLAASHAAAIPLQFGQAFVALTALNVALAVPTPANLGAVEGGIAAALTSFGVPLPNAVAFGFVYHAAQLLSALTLGTFAAWLVARRSSVALAGVNVAMSPPSAT